jgi:hypothetical protein
MNCTDLGTLATHACLPACLPACLLPALLQVPLSLSEGASCTAPAAAHLPAHLPTHACPALPQVPVSLFDLPDLSGVLSLDTWREALSEEERAELRQLLPPGGCRCWQGWPGHCGAAVCIAIVRLQQAEAGAAGRWVLPLACC